MNPREPRLYPYDAQHAAWSSGQVDIEFMTNGYTYDGSNQYYPSSSHDLNPVNDSMSSYIPSFWITAYRPDTLHSG